jgi:CheY-like chemotaxis protein
MSAHPQILVANDPPLYREVLGSQLPRLRPGLTVLLVDPADLDEAVARLRPQLVLCSELTDAVRQSATAAIVLDPDGTKRAVLTIDGQQQVLLNPGLTELLAAVDAAVGQEPGTAIPRSR